MIPGQLIWCVFKIPDKGNCPHCGKDLNEFRYKMVVLTVSEVVDLERNIIRVKEHQVGNDQFIPHGKCNIFVTPEAAQDFITSICPTTIIGPENAS